MRIAQVSWLIFALLFAAGACAQTVKSKPAKDPAAAKPVAGADATAGGKPTSSPLNIPPDALREQTIVEAITTRIPPAEVIWLDVDGAKVLALFSEQTTSRPRGAVLLLHGMEGNPDEPALIHRLRTMLPKSGWSVLAVQLPVLPIGSPREAYGGTVEAAGKRVTAALAQLKAAKPLSIVIVGQELGAALALSAAAGNKEVRAVAALSLSSAEGLNPAIDVLAIIEKLDTPVLDLSGAFAGAAERKSSEQRATAARKAQRPNYRQATLAGTDDMLTGATDAAVNRVRAWLNRTADEAMAKQEPQ